MQKAPAQQETHDYTPNNLHELTTNWHKYCNPRKALTGNYADYVLCKPHVCCGWMDLHSDDDYGVTEEQPYFRIKPLYWDSNARLVVTNDKGLFVALEPTLQVIVFNGMRLHGLVPVEVAEELVERQDTNGKLYNLLTLITQDSECNPKMIWDWLDVSERQEDDLFIP